MIACLHTKLSPFMLELNPRNSRRRILLHISYLLRRHTIKFVPCNIEILNFVTSFANLVSLFLKCNSSNIHYSI